MWIYKFFVFCLYLIISTSAVDEITLDIRQGKLKGLKATTITNGKPYFSFKGIPYAQPNVGSNKFRVSLKYLIFYLENKKKNFEIKK